MTSGPQQVHAFNIFVPGVLEVYWETIFYGNHGTEANTDPCDWVGSVFANCPYPVWTPHSKICLISYFSCMIFQIFSSLNIDWKKINKGWILIDRILVFSVRIRVFFFLVGWEVPQLPKTKKKKKIMVLYKILLMSCGSKNKY